MRQPGERSLERIVRTAWQRRGAVACTLWPLSWLYRCVIALRRWLYAAGWLASQSVGVPVLVVGNLVAGGAGKTPVVLSLLRHCRARGIAVGVVSRGHGRLLTRRLPDLREVQDNSTAALVGDEPLLIRQLTGVPVFVARDRLAAARALLARRPEIRLILSDDGLQHLALRRDAELCVLGANGIGNGWVLPAGPLREAGRGVTWVLDAGEASQEPPGLAASRGRFRCRRALAAEAHDAQGRSVTLTSLIGQPVQAVAGIAHPEAFFAMLRACGLELASTQALPDHYSFDSYQGSSDQRLPLVCTEKDAVKLWRLQPQALAVPLELTIDAAFFESFDEWFAGTAAQARLAAS